jgi:hypothetical protein
MKPADNDPMRAYSQSLKHKAMKTHVHAHGFVQPMGLSARQYPRQQQRATQGQARRQSHGKELLKKRQLGGGNTTTVTVAPASTRQDENANSNITQPQPPQQQQQQQLSGKKHHRHATAITDRTLSKSLSDIAVPVEIQEPQAAAAPSTKSPSLLTTDVTQPLEDESSSVRSSDNVHSDSIVDSISAGMSGIHMTPSAASSSSSVTAPDSHPPPTHARLLAAAASAAPLPRNDWVRLAPHLTLMDEQQDIRHHLLAREQSARVTGAYIHQQPELNFLMREILIDWLQGVAFRYRFKPETMMGCTSLLDRFLSVRECARSKFQLVGITCLIVAAKYEEVRRTSLHLLVWWSEHLDSSHPCFISCYLFLSSVSPPLHRKFYRHHR